MQPRPPFDRALLIPIAVGVVSILGIGWILSASNLSEVLIPPTAAPTTIPFEVSPIETGPLPPPSTTPTVEETPATATGTSPEPSAETLPSTSVPVTESRPVPSATPTLEQVEPLPAGKYDDTDPNIAYDRYWTVLKNQGTANAHKGTIHISTSMGSEASFRFTGQRLYIGYQRGRNFGTVIVMIDDQPYSFHEQAFDLTWRSPPLSPGIHFVRVIHESGESINLDYIQVLD